ncbi:MAG: phosphoglycolate phosphatase [Steroidobacterales bacterium]
MLLDLDGTLLDTAPDMAAALNALRAEEQLPALDFSPIRAQVSHGSNAVVRVGFPYVGDGEFERLRSRFLALYRAALAVQTRPFPGFRQVLQTLQAAHIPWGVVTNKPGWLAEPLLQELGLLAHCGALICGDTLPERKPHPRPLLVAAERIGVAPARCLYLGDALRDIQAARAAGMVALVASFGYFAATDDPAQWPADAWIDSPLQLLPWVGLIDAMPRRPAPPP